MPRDANGHGSDPKLTPEIAQKIVQAVRTGSSLEGSAKYAGVPPSTFFDWLKRGRNPRGFKPYRDLAAALDEALGAFEVNANALIAKAAVEKWDAAAWQLERKFPDRYGRRTRIDGNVQVSAVPFVDLSKLTTDEAATLLGLLRKAAPAQEQLPAAGRPALELVAGPTEAVEA
jgi:hypothetical protein